MAYDSKAVKISKSVKRIAATLPTKAERRKYIREHVVIAEQEVKNRNMRNRSTANPGSDADE